MANFIDITGQKFGKLTALRRDPRPANAQGVLWLCECICGKQRTVRRNCLVKGHTISCGCLYRVGRHRHAAGGRESPTYKSWSHMKERCLNPKCKSFKDYGERGILIHDKWINSFDEFLSDMGEKPKGDYTIERVDNDGHYEPSNCIWIERKYQSENRRYCRYFAYRGKTQTIAAWAREYHIKYNTLYMRIRRGDCFEMAISM